MEFPCLFSQSVDEKILVLVDGMSMSVFTDMLQIIYTTIFNPWHFHVNIQLCFNPW